MNKALYLNEKELNIMKVLWSADRPMAAADIARMAHDENIANTLKALETAGSIKVVRRDRIGGTICRIFCPAVSSDKCALDQFRLYYVRQNSIPAILSEVIGIIEEGKPDILFRLKELLRSSKCSTKEAKGNSFYLNEKEGKIMKALWSSYEPLSASDIARRIDEDWAESTIYRFIKSLIAKKAVNIADYTQMGKVYGRLFSPAVSSEEYSVGQFSLYYVKENELPHILYSLVDNVSKGKFQLIDKTRELIEGFS